MAASSRHARLFGLAVAVLLVTGSARAETAEPASAESPAGQAAPTASDTKTHSSKKPHHKPHRGKKKKPTSAKPHRVRRKRQTLGFVVRTRVTSGWLHGRGIRRFDAAFLETRLFAMPKLRLKNVSLWAPLAYSQRTTAPSVVPETRGSAGLEGQWRVVPSVALSGGAGAHGAFRPSWPDPYQPLLDGKLGTSNRASYFARDLEVGTALGRRRTVELHYEYTLIDGTDDPTFEPIERPSHLVPADRDEHRAGAELHLRVGACTLEPSFEFSRRHYFFEFARDRFTGATHAAAGGPPPNPLLVLDRLQPAAEATCGERSRELAVRFVYDVMIDEFEGYASYQGPRATLRGSTRVTHRLELEGTVNASYWRYGAGSYRPEPHEPPLEYGSRRSDRRLRASLDTALDLGAGFTAFFEANVSARRTNFPDYVPGVFPRGAAYRIDWDYVNYGLGIGLRYRAAR